MTEKNQPKKESSTLGVLLKKARERKGISQAELARTAGVSTRTIHSLETGVWTSVRDEVVIRLADALAQSVEEWVKAAGHDYDEQRATLVRQLHSYARRGVVEPEPFPLDELLQKEATFRSLVKTPYAKLEIWVIEAHQPAEVRDASVMKVVRDNVRKGVTYRYFFPISATGTKPLEPYSWDQGHKEAIDGIRQAVEQHSDLSNTNGGTVLGYGVDPTEFPVFMFNMGTVIFWKEGNVESEQDCYRVVNITDPKRAWCFPEDTTAVRPLIQFLQKKVRAQNESKQSTRGSTP